MAEPRLSQLLSHRQFIRFWLARLAGIMANQMLMVGSVVLAGVGTMLVAVTWLKLFPALARRDRIV